ncbi:MAG: oligosaccharide flippase family protein [Planctomycetota bacterium]
MSQQEANAEAAEPELERPELERRARRSSLFTVGGYGLGNVLRLASNVLLADLLFPEVFGEMVLVSLLLLGIGMFSDVGIGPCLVQSRRGRESAFAHTAFTIQLLRGITIGIVGYLLAPWFVDYYEAPTLLWPVRAACLTAVLQGFNSTKWFTVTRDLALGRKTAVELVAQAASITVCVVWASLSPNIWALVAGNVAQCAVIALLSHVALPGAHDRLRIESAALRELMHFGRWVFVSTCITFLALQSDRLILGKLVDSIGMLGVYGMAGTIATIPTVLSGHLSGNVQYPLLAAYDRSDSAGLEQAFLRQRATLLVGLGAMLLAVFWFAPLFFRTLYRADYHDAGWIAQWLCLAGWFALLKQTADRVLLVRGATRALAAVNLAAFVSKAGGTLIGFHVAGFHGFLVGLVAGAAIEQLVVQWVVRGVGISVVRQDALASLAALVVCVAGWRIQLVAHTELRPLPGYALEIGFGALLLGLAVAQGVQRYKKVGLA